MMRIPCVLSLRQQLQNLVLACDQENWAELDEAGTDYFRFGSLRFTVKKVLQAGCWHPASEASIKVILGHYGCVQLIQLQILGVDSG